MTLGDPGITIDEPLDVKVGRRYVEAIASGRWDPFRPEHVAALFADNAQHPPLGRLLVGAASKLAEPFEGLLGGPDPFSVHAARLAPAAALGILVGLIVAAAARGYGPAAGIGAGAALVMMPRVFAHGHFATLDTFLTLFWVAALLCVGRAAARPRPTLSLALAGIVWGLALLTKIHAWLLPPLVLAWVVVRLGWRRGLPAFGLWMLVGLACLFAGWPWLWHAPMSHLRDFLSTSVERQALRVEYFGHVYLDRDVPWHYPWFHFAATVPIGLHLLGLVGAIAAWRRRREEPEPLLWLGGILLLLAVFSTRAPVYDGERLFLPVFPLWALFVGRGTAIVGRTLMDWASNRWGPGRDGEATPTWPVRTALVLVVVAQGWGLVRLHPFQLSYYNALVGGLPGAMRRGLELTYWGDAVDRGLLDAVAARVGPGESVALVPTLHHVQAVATTTSSLAARGVILQDQSAAARASWLVVFRRTSYWPDRLADRLRGRPPTFANVRQGVWLAAAWKMSDDRPGPVGKTPGGD